MFLLYRARESHMEQQTMCVLLRAKLTARELEAPLARPTTRIQPANQRLLSTVVPGFCFFFFVRYYRHFLFVNWNSDFI